MGVFFKFTEEGDILVARTAPFKKIDDKEFYKKAKHVSSEKFLSKYSEERGQLEKELEMLTEIYNLKLSIVGPVVQYLPEEGLYPVGCYVGDKYFGGFYESYRVKKEAFEYGNKFFGKDKMDYFIKEGYFLFPNNISDEKYKVLAYSSYALLLFFAGDEEISEDEYFKLIKIRENLTSIRDARYPLQTKVSLKKYQ